MTPNGRSDLTFLNWIFRIALVCLLLGSPSTASPPSDVSAIAQGVDRRYDHLSSLQADFVEIYTGAGTERTESGALWLKKPGKMRWEYRSPREKLFLSDGKQAWFFIPGEKQARKIPMRQLDDLRSPLAFLLGRTKLQKELKGLSLAADLSPAQVGDIVLRGSPAGMEDRVTQVVLEITGNSEIYRIQLNGTDGSVTEYTFGNRRENVQVSDRMFHFSPPPGVEIIEGDLAQ